jgi:hypothetical protein
MRKHIKLLGALYLVWGMMGVVALVTVLLLLAVGTGLAALDNPEAGVVIGSLSAILIVVVAATSLPNLMAGWGLLKYHGWARILTIILCLLNLPAFPFGTALGLYGLWVMFHAETVTLFQTGGPGRPAPSPAGMSGSRPD